MMWFCLLLWFQTPQDQWSQANQAYQDGDYQQAVELYRGLWDDQVRNGKVAFNLGNAYYRAGELGNALLFYYRAQQYLPGDADVAQNLAIADAQRVDPPIEGENQALVRRLERWVYGVSYGGLFALAFVLLLIAGASSAWMVIRPSKLAGYLLTISGILSLCFILLVFVHHQQLSRKDAAVVLAERVDVRSGPSTRESVGFTIHEGIRCVILDEAEGWYRIRLANGYNGWLERTAVEKI